jgi:hypothetical protein
MVKAVIVTGLAGSGKTMLSYSLMEWYKNIKQDIAILNLDPGVLNLPYKPDVDVREFINIWNLMEKHSIGPNSALILSMDLLLDYIERINNLVNQLNPKILIVDTPGQMEIFAYRMSGKFFVDLLDVEEKMLIFVLDGVFVSDPRNLLSNLLVSASVKIRFELPFILVLNKLDLISKESERRLQRWLSNPNYLYESLSSHYSEDEAMFLVRMFRSMKSYDLLSNYIPLSAITLENLDLLIQAISRVLFRGHEY